VTTDTGGAFGAADLPPGTYTITLTVPNGYTTTDPLSKTATITAAGETFAAEDFTIDAVVTPPVTPPATPPVTPPANEPGTTAGSGASEDLAATGSNFTISPALFVAGVLIAAGAAALEIGRRRRSASRSD
jgi:PKD repeat protein